MSEISSTTIQHFSRLARLELTEEEHVRFADQLTSVVAYIDQLGEVDTSSVKEMWGVSGNKNVLAEDASRTQNDPCAVDSTLLLSGAPRSDGSFILVRAVMEDGGSSA